MASDDEPRRVWYCLKTPIGGTYSKTSADTVSLASGSDIAQFRDAVKAKSANTLKGIDAFQLTVYKNEDSLNKALEDKKNKPDSNDKEEGPLKSSFQLTGLGIEEEDALMVVVPVNESKRQKMESPKVQWELQAGEFPRNLAFEFRVPDIDLPSNEFRNIGSIASDTFLTIEFKFHADSGLVKEKTDSKGSDELQAAAEFDLMLYCRRAFIHQIAYLSKYAIRHPAFCWVVGPPGSGKSCAAFAFALSLDPSEWNVVWIHYRKQRLSFRCVRFLKNTKSTLRIPNDKVREGINHVLEQRQPNATEKTIVFLDGYINDDDAVLTALTLCVNWQEDNKLQRRFVCVSSMVGRGKHSKLSGCDNVVNSRRETVYFDPMTWVSWSWSLEEYMLAIKKQSFFDSVKARLSNSIQERNITEAEKIESVTTKFQIAGTNARFMFGMTIATVVEELESAIAAAMYIKEYVDKGITEHSNGVMNRLLSIELDSEKKKFSSILSRYVGEELAIRFGPTIVLQLKSILSEQVNPVMDGFFLEWWFLAQLHTKGGVPLHRKGARTLSAWLSPARIKKIDPNNHELVNTVAEESPAWLRPVLWNQAGYDALVVDKAKGFVRFIQVTRASKHKFVPEAFSNVLTKLAEGGMNVKVVELAFVVPIAIMKTYKSLELKSFQSEVIDKFNRQNPNGVTTRGRARQNRAKGIIHTYGLSWKLDESQVQDTLG